MVGAQVVEVEEYGGDFATGEEYWSKALEILSAEKKIAMVSCAKGGKVISYLNGILRVGFKAAFQCDRMNKDDYRKGPAILTHKASGFKRLPWQNSQGAAD